MNSSNDENNRDRQTLLEFPCEFPIKVMGKASESFETAVLSIISRHVPDIHEGALATRQSKDGNYLAITITITATSQHQLDEIYSELTANEHVLMAL